MSFFRGSVLCSWAVHEKTKQGGEGQGALPRLLALRKESGQTLELCQQVCCGAFLQHREPRLRGPAGLGLRWWLCNVPCGLVQSLLRSSRGNRL